MDQGERLDRLAVDVDTRLTQLWLIVLEPGGAMATALEGNDQLREVVGASLRIAYTCGYKDALNEDRDGRRAELHRTHGYRPE